eukprot:m.869884 g.869884  ORF g.869884 m.869884 type:complete len:101 (+) comp59747_c1_seq6:101-403(+)
MFRVRLCVLLTLVASCRAKSLSPGSRALSPLSPSRSPKPDDDDLSGSEAEHSDLSSVGSPTRTNGRATSKRGCFALLFFLFLPIVASIFPPHFSSRCARI